jgi:hypothetical protein
MKKLIILLLFIPLVFSCSDFWWAHDDDVSQYLVLNVENYNSNFPVIRISLVNNEFNDLNITSGTNESFELINTPMGDLSNIDVYIEINCISDPSIILSKSLDFSNGSAQIIILNNNSNSQNFGNCNEIIVQ